RGVTWSPLAGLPVSDFNIAAFNPANPDQIYVGSDGDQGTGGVFRSLDRGASWSTFGAGLPSKPRITALALQPLNPPQVVAAAWRSYKWCPIVTRGPPPLTIFSPVRAGGCGSVGLPSWLQAAEGGPRRSIARAHHSVEADAERGFA